MNIWYENLLLNMERELDGTIVLFDDFNSSKWKRRVSRAKNTTIEFMNPRTTTFSYYVALSLNNFLFWKCSGDT
jgi:hypothetical protein